MSAEDVTDLRVWLDEQINEARERLERVVNPLLENRLHTLREVQRRVTPDTSAYAAKAGPAAARGYADGWNARRAHEEAER